MPSTVAIVKARKPLIMMRGSGLVVVNFGRKSVVGGGRRRGPQRKGLRERSMIGEWIVINRINHTWNDGFITTFYSS